MRIAKSIVVAVAVIAAGSISPALAKKDGNEVRNESGSSGKGKGSDDRQVFKSNSGRDDDNNSGSGHGSSGNGGGNSGSNHGSSLDEVSVRLDGQSGHHIDQTNATLKRVRFSSDDRL